MIYIFFVFLFLGSNLMAQEWDFIESPVKDSIVEIKGFTQNGNTRTERFGTGCLFAKTKNKLGNNREFLILTASHVVYDNMSIVTQSGKVSKATLIKKTNIPEKDVAILSCYLPEDTKYVSVGKLDKDKEVEINGFGSYKKGPKLRSFKSRWVGPKNPREYNIYDQYVIPGDSGGPITQDGKIVGVVTGGFTWYDGEVQYAWPTLSAKNEFILEYVNGYNQNN